MTKQYGKCKWCKLKGVPLHEHHYPISKSVGGTKKIKICLNCHHKFHYPPMKILDLRGSPLLSKKIKQDKKLTKDDLKLAHKNAEEYCY